ncbi:MAG: c-type cytochrome [Rubrimonas sp.]
MNTFELNKIFGAATAAFLVYLLAGFAAEQVYHVDAPKELAYALEIEEADAAGGGGEPEVDLASLLAAADPAAGAAAFRKCSACHKLEDGANGVGPHLHQVVGRAVGSVAGYRYSGALNAAADVWGFEELDAFLTNPKAYAPGTSMGFAGIAKADERAAVIVYLNQEGGSNLPLPEPAAAEPAAEDAAEAPAEAAPEEDVAAAAPSEDEAAADVDGAVASDGASEEVAVAEQAEPEVSPLQAALDAADPARGERLFAACAICHSTDEGAHGIGPSLHNIPGADVASAGFFPYSDAFRAVGGVWSIERLDAYLADPSGFVGAQRVGFPGVADQQDRADIIAFLNSQRREPLSLDLGEETAVVGDEEPTEAAADTGAASAEEEPAVVADAAPAAEEAPPADAAPAVEKETAAAEPAEPAEEVATAAEEAADEAPAAAASSDDPFAVAYAAASLQDGQRAFRKCSACHKLDEGANGVGPSLHGIVGREIASVAGFSYSDALAGKGGVWDYEALNGWLENPRGWAPGNRMAFAGIRSLEERAALIRYLNEEGGSNVPAP